MCYTFLWNKGQTSIKNFHDFKMRKAFIALLAIFLINGPSLYYGWNLRWAWFDIILHFSGGFFMAMFMTAYLKERLFDRDGIKNALIIAGATVFMGVMWEFAEYIANQTLIEQTYLWFRIKVYFMGDLNDTILDLFLDIVGALVFILTLYRRQANS